MPTAPVPLTFHAPAPGRVTREPVTVGLPWPKGAARDRRQFQLITPDGTDQRLDAAVLATHADGSVRWCLFDFLVTLPEGYDPNMTSGYAIAVMEAGRSRQDTTADWADLPPATLRLTFAGDPRAHELDIAVVETRPPGVVRRRSHFAKALPRGVRLFGFVDDFAGGRSHCQVTVQNTSAADHPGGNWDLGNGGSVEVAALSVVFDPPQGGVRLSPERGRPLVPVDLPLTLHQESSGGENWQSRAHVDRTGTVRLAYRGYKLESGNAVTEGLRATPLLSVGDTSFGMAEFWQNFPAAIHVDDRAWRLDLWPEVADRPHELQGGEQKTWTFRLAHGCETPETLRTPVTARADATWYFECEALPQFLPQSLDGDGRYARLTRLAVEGDDTFLAKRERLDGYGWRNYGDLYGDHEAVYHTGPTPLVSHNNNQYDCVLALLEHYLRTGEEGYHAQGLACAFHTADVDIYHTSLDKPAYNGGLFWHTYHYADAGTGNHRSYPKSLRNAEHFASGQELTALCETGRTLKKVLAVGGGPAGSHNYNAGLGLAYLLTGNPLFIDAAVGLANYVLTADAPRGGVPGLLSRNPSGVATESSHDYHGPGRAGGNSVLALLTGFHLTGDRKYLDAADAIVRRVSHPEQDLGRLDLLNAELRWFYTMFLQAVGEYLETLAAHELFGTEQYAYAQGVLLHYARWMLAHERPVLDHPERLQYPTETWAAQDLRKAEVLCVASAHAPDELRGELLAKAEFFHDYCVSKLDEFPTKTLCRPMILVMRYGHKLRASRARPRRFPTAPPRRWEPHPTFVPQKQMAVRRVKLLIRAGVVFMAVTMIAGVAWLLSS